MNKYVVCSIKNVLYRLFVAIAYYIFSYNPGDVLMIQPCNIEEIVEEFLTLVGWLPDTMVSIKERPDGIKFYT